MKKSFIFLFSALFLGACTEVGQYSDPDKVVVDGLANAGELMTITLTRQLVYGGSDSVYYPVENLPILITGSGGQDETMTYLGSGKYTTSQLLMQVGQTYHMSFEYNDKQVSAITTVPAKPESFQASSDSISAAMSPGVAPATMSFSWSNPDKKYYLIVVQNLEDDPRLIISDTTRVTPKKIFRSEITQGTSLSFTSRSFYYYGKHAVILYAINDEYVPFYQETNTTSQDIISLKTNVQNGLGVFTTTNSDTLAVKVY